MKLTTRNFIFTLLLVLSLTLAACGSPAATEAPATEAAATEAPATEAATEAPTEAAAPANPNLILATTTSTQDSGLLDVLVPMFEEQTGYTVQTVAVGTGEALKMGEEGNADVLLVHHLLRKTFMDGGNGQDRFLVMHNDFIIVGPAEDPTAIKELGPKEAFVAIFNAGAPFVSRSNGFLAPTRRK